MRKALVILVAGGAVLLVGILWFRQTEYAAWRDFRRVDSIVGYGRYLEAWPGGRHTGEARSRLESLEWEAAALLNTTEAYAAYLEKYPGGSWSAQATARQDSISWAGAVMAHTIESYSAYCGIRPNNAAHVSRAQMEITRLKNRSGVLWLRNCRSARVTVRASYRFAGRDSASMRKLLISYLTAAGIDVVDDSSITPDLTVAASLEAKPLSATYKDEKTGNTGRYYTGATSEVRVRLRGPGGRECVLHAARERTPPSWKMYMDVGRPYPSGDPSRAPTWVGIDSLQTDLSRLFGDVFGIKVWVPEMRGIYSLVVTTENRIADKAAEELLGMGYPAVDSLIVAARKGSIAAAKLLWRTGDPRTVDTLLECMRSRDIDVRAAAAASLGECRDSRIGPVLVRALNDESANVSVPAARSLGKLSDVSTVLGMVESFESGSHPSWIDGEIVAALREMGPQAIEELQRMELEGSPTVRLKTEKILGLLRGRTDHAGHANGD